MTHQFPKEPRQGMQLWQLALYPIIFIIAFMCGAEFVSGTEESFVKRSVRACLEHDGIPIFSHYDVNAMERCDQAPKEAR